jgi:ABC-type multidrug transport system permease subunit
MKIWTLAKKEMRLLLRDPKAAVILLVMPLLFILVLGVSLGEGFGQKPDDRLRVSIVDLDRGPPRFFDRPAMLREGMAQLAVAPVPGQVGGVDATLLSALTLAGVNRSDWFPHRKWSEVVRRDLAETGGIRVEMIPSLDQARELVRQGKRAAVLVLGPRFSRRVARCSFLGGERDRVLTFLSGFPRPGLPVNLALAGLYNENQQALPLYLLDGINPFYRDGVTLGKLDVELLRDETQLTAASIIEQVAQGALLRVILPWMIGRAFEKIGDLEFIDSLNERIEISVPVLGKVKLRRLVTTLQQKRQIGSGVQRAIQELFPNYNLTAKTWTALTKSRFATGGGAGTTEYHEEGSGLLKRGALRYQLLVPSYTVMFAFFMVLTVGWLFVSERRQGTLKRLRAAPLTRTQILLGKFVPCFLLSLGQGLFLMLAGKWVFGMSWGPEPAWLFLVVFTTSLSAMGLALFVAALARTETQVAIYGTLLVLVLAGVSGCLMGDRALMPERMQEISRVTPHAWALDAYRQLLTSPAPVYAVVGQACAVLAGFGLGFVLLAWWTLKLE